MKIKLTNENDSVVIEKSNGTSSDVATKADISAITKSDIGLGNVGNFKAVSTVANQELTDAEKANARTNIGVPALIGDDAARANWGGDWRMPTTAEFQALGAAVNTEWTTDYQSSGVAGLVCTDKTDSSKVLFLPAAGSCSYGCIMNVGIRGSYWSSSLTIDKKTAYNIKFISSDAYWGDISSVRYLGFPVRPILDGANANGHDYVEIGGLKWATMNIGASSISDYGLYFQWGDTQGYTASQVGSGEGQKFFGWADYKYGNGTSSPGAAGMTKYNGTDGKTVLELPTPVEYLQKVAVTGDYNDLSNKPTIPTALSQLSEDSTHRTVSDTEKTTWGNKQDALVSGTNIKTVNNESLLGSGNISVVTELPSNLAYISNDSGVGIVPEDGIRAETVTSAAAMTINPDVVTVINGAVGTSAITLQVPNDNLAHVWDILLTTDSSVAITFAMSNSETILYPNGFSVGASKAVEVSVIGVGTKYYLRYGEFA